MINFNDLIVFDDRDTRFVAIRRDHQFLGHSTPSQGEPSGTPYGGRLAWVLVSWRCRRMPALLNSNSRWPAVELQSSNTYRPGTTRILGERLRATIPRVSTGSRNSLYSPLAYARGSEPQRNSFQPLASARGSENPEPRHSAD